MKEIANLTGHDIMIVDHSGLIIKVIKPCEYEEPIRASITFKNIGHCEGAPLDTINFSCDISDEKMKELQRNYSLIIVSKITAECLKQRGYSDIYITGRKYFLEGEMIGVRSLSKYC